MIRNKADFRTIGFLAFFAALVATGWVLDPGGWATAGLVALTMLWSWLCAIIAHNTVHCAVFTKRWMNRAFQVWVSLSYGFPVSEYVSGHNLSHHRFMQKREDVMRTSKVDFGWNLLNFLLFFVMVGPGVTAGNYRYKAMARERIPAWNRQLNLELAAVWGVKLALLAIDWRKALLYYVVPHLFAVWGITTVNFLQHDGTDEDHPYNHSRNFVGKLFNWFTFGNGYHGIHHMHPNLHWTLAARKHAEELAPHNHPELNQPSLLLYLFKAFVWPGKRVRYDGQPTVVHFEPDLDWVSATREAVSADDLGAVGSPG